MAVVRGAWCGAARGAVTAADAVSASAGARLRAQRTMTLDGPYV